MEVLHTERVIENLSPFRGSSIPAIAGMLESGIVRSRVSIFVRCDDILNDIHEESFCDVELYEIHRVIGQMIAQAIYSVNSYDEKDYSQYMKWFCIRLIYKSESERNNYFILFIPKGGW